jgi:hypothetical protein
MRDISVIASKRLICLIREDNEITVGCLWADDGLG